MQAKETLTNERYLQGGDFCIYYIRHETGRMIYGNDTDNFRRFAPPGFVVTLIS